MTGRPDFDQRSLHLGALLGVRAFGLMPTGNALTGPVYPGDPFKPGENIAVCKAGGGKKADIGRVVVSMKRESRTARVETDRGQPLAPIEQLAMERMINHLGGILGGSGNNLSPYHAMASTLGAMSGYQISVGVKPLDPEEEPVHQVAQQDCTCGFYAYFDRNHNPHDKGPSNVLGLIEGYGLVTVGKRGFRAAKARLVALVGVPESKATDPMRYEQREVEDRNPSDNFLYGYKKQGVLVGTERAIPDKIIENYNVPVFPTMDLAEAEYPLTDPNIEED